MICTVMELSALYHDHIYSDGTVMIDTDGMIHVVSQI